MGRRLATLVLLTSLALVLPVQPSRAAQAKLAPEPLASPSNPAAAVPSSGGALFVENVG